MKNIYIVGVGLIGGSFALELHNEILIYPSPFVPNIIPGATKIPNLYSRLSTNSFDGIDLLIFAHINIPTLSLEKYNQF